MNLLIPALAAATLLATSSAIAQRAGAGDHYPVRPVRLIIPYSPGGASDNIARLVMPRLGESLGQTIVIDNRPGASGNLGRDLGAKAPPDGYTLLSTDSPHAINVHLQSHIPYDPLRDFATITTTATAAIVMAVNANFPAKTAGDLITLAKAQPGKFNFGSGGVGSITHVAGELFKISSGANIVHVPYKSISLAITDLLGGQMDIAFTSPATISGHVRSGRLRQLASASTKRLPAYPETPTFAEAGVPSMIAANWFGIMGPAKLPQPIIQKLNAEIHKAVRHREVQERFAVAGIETLLGTPREFQLFLESETARWGKVIKAAGLKPE